jgi:DtxR family transcriptional regulator, manganese transport regulator
MKRNLNRAHPFIATRKHHLKEAAEDYTELIADLIDLQGEARTCEVARQLGVSHVTALRTLQRLQKEGYITTERHKPIFLTEKGKKVAAQSKERHKILLEFLLSIGVPEEVAHVDAEGMEHHLSPETLKAIERQLQS